MPALERLERYEFKYLLPERLAPAERSAALATCVRDRHGDPATGSYAIRSLYLDNDRLDLYQANGREQRNRFKARIRGYPGKTAPVFFELKRRVGDVIVKSRTPVSAGSWQEAIRRPPSPDHPAQAFLAALRIHHLKPMVLVEYDREAYASIIDNYARVTLDRRVVSQAVDRFELEAPASGWRPIDHVARTNVGEPVFVLELKFERRPPRWMVSLVQRLDLIRRSFSKYCYGIEAQRLLPGNHRQFRSAG